MDAWCGRALRQKFKRPHTHQPMIIRNPLCSVKNSEGGGNACISIGFNGFWEDVMRGGRRALRKSSNNLIHINQ